MYLYTIVCGNITQFSNCKFEIASGLQEFSELKNII
jgi:hypothetical protein